MNKNKAYGKLRKEDVPMLEEVIDIFKAKGLHCGLHGTSLWNPRYKDIDVLVFSPSNNLSSFKEGLKEMLSKERAEVLGQRGDDLVGLDYDIKMGTVIVHLSFVILL